MGLKFAGRTESRGARFLRGNASTRHMVTTEGAVFASAAAGLGVLCLLVALLRQMLGAPQIGFWQVFWTLPLICSRLASLFPPETALWLMGGVLLFGALWYGGAYLLGRRAPDALLFGLLAFQFFFVARFFGSLLPPAAPLQISALAFPQKINALLQIALLMVGLLWSTRPPENPGYGSSAPSRVTGFLKRRRMPLRLAGVLIMALAIAASVCSGLFSFDVESAPDLLRPPVLFAIWLALDGFYLLGRALWQRVY